VAFVPLSNKKPPVPGWLPNTNLLKKRTCHVLQSASCPQKASVRTNYNKTTATMYDSGVHILFDFNCGGRI